MTPQTISIIIPTLNEATSLETCVTALGSTRDFELIIVDGGSVDETATIGRGLKATVLTTTACRAIQMNAGANVATNEIFLFLHADTILPHDWRDHVQDTLQIPGIALGAFQFALDDQGFKFRLIERLANFRSVFFQMPYGDQALFIKRETFHKVGGFPEISIMEDYAFCRAVRKFGKIETGDSKAITSGRRWRRLGFIKTTFVNQLVIFLYNIGAPHRILRRIYDSVR